MWRILSALSAVSALALVACASPHSGSGAASSSGDSCAALRAHRGTQFFAIDLDAGDAGLDGDVVELGPDASPACEGPCMAMATAERLPNPAFTSCHESNVSIGCTVEVDEPQPCDLVGP